MIPILATSTKANLLIYVGGGGFILLGSFFFGRLVTFFFPKNPLIRKIERNNHERLSNDRTTKFFLLIIDLCGYLVLSRLNIQP